MSGSPLVSAIANRLEAAGYSSVPTPFKVASVSFDFTRVMRGRAGRSLDLVIIVDTTTGQFGDKDPLQVRRRVEALSRALDVTGSRLVLTVILAGASMSTEVEALAETSRVLVVETLGIEIDGTPRDVQAARLLDDRIRLLLPLEIPVRDGGDAAEPSPIESLLSAFPEGVDAELVKALMEASREGEEAVTQSISVIIDKALKVEEPK